MVQYSFIYVALSCLILSKLSMGAIKTRVQKKISFGDNGDDEMIRRVRAQGNFVEYTPIFLLSLISIEWLSIETIPYYVFYINIVGTIFIIGRILHALSLYDKKIMHRRTGMKLTFLSLRFNGFFLLFLVPYKLYIL